MKKFVLKISIILIILAVIISCISFIYYSYYNVEIRNHYENLYDISLQNTKLNLETKVKKSFDDLYISNENQIIPDGYYGFGELSESKKLKIKTNNDIIQKDLQDESFNDFIVFDTNIIQKSIEDVSCIIYIKKINGKYIILLETYEHFKSKIGETNFDNIVFCDIHGNIVGSKEYLIQKNVYKLVNYNYLGQISDTNHIYVDITNEKNLLIKQVTDIENFYVIGYKNSNEIENTIKGELNKNLLYIFTVGIITFIGTSLMIFIYLSGNNNNYIGKFSRGKYVLIINKYGKILKKSRVFAKEFSINEILIHTVEDNNFVREALEKNGNITLNIKNKSQTEKYLRFMTAKIFIGYKLIGTDCTEQVKDHIQAKFLINCNGLSQLPNQKQLKIDYERALLSYKNEVFCFTIFEIIGLEKYKVMFGEKFYQQIIRKFSARLNEIFKGMTYHIDINRFLVFTYTTETTDYIVHESEKFISIMNAPYIMDVHCIKIDYKAGQSKMFSAREKLDMSEQLRQAKQGLHSSMISHNKTMGVFYDALMRTDMAIYESKQSIDDLINSDGLTLFFQPQYSSKQERIVGFEALTRMKKKSNISIQEFIELAERNGSIIELGNFVYKKAMSFAKEMEDEKISISINVSPVQLLQEGFVENFLREYNKYNLKDHSIAVEITETFLMSCYDEVIGKLKILRNKGIDIHLDDFGVAYSSMLYLKRLPITAIKIDREFIKDIIENKYSNAITDTIISLTNQLELKCIAEGVETHEQMELINSLNCDIIQGYYISKAVDKEKAKELCKLYKNKEI